MQILDYLRLCLWYSAGSKSSPNDLKNVPLLIAFIRRHYEPTESNETQKYLDLVKQILVAKRGLTELTCLYDLLNAELGTLTEQCLDLLENFALALKDVSETTRVLVAQIVGILWAIGNSLEKFNDVVS